MKYQSLALTLLSGSLAFGLLACGDDSSPTTISDEAESGPIPITVTVTNLQPSDGAVLTPVFLATQNGNYDMFTLGATASPSVERLAEDGATGDRITAALTSGGVEEATATNGPLMPGESRSVSFTVEADNPLTQYLSFMSMVIPSNDAFIGNDDPREIDLFDTQGNLITYQGSTAIIISGEEVLDAGTEENDEVFENTAFLPNMAIFPGQTVPNTGIPEGGVIFLHPGFQGSVGSEEPVGNVLEAFPGADFTETGALMMQIEISSN